MNASEARFANFVIEFTKFKVKNAELPDRGMLKLFAESLDLSPRYLSHVKCGRKQIGSATARQIESKLGLRNGYMDHVHDDLDPGTAEERMLIGTILALYRKSPAAARKLMLDALNAALNESAPDKPAALSLNGRA